jgi:hypothetical protein
MPNIDEQLAKEVALTLRQTEIIRAQVDLLFLHLTDLARRVGIHLIDPSQPPPAVTEPTGKKV